MIEISDITRMVKEQGESAKKWREQQETRFQELQSHVDDLAKSAGRPALGGSSPSSDVDRKGLEQGLRAWIAGDQTKANELFIQSKAMSAGSGPDGGYLVAPDFSTQMTKVLAEASPIYRLARKIEVNGDGFEEPVDKDLAQAVWVGETEARPDTDNPQLGMFTVQLAEIYTQPKVSQKLIDTARIDVVGWLRDKIAEAFADKEAAAFHTGDGVGKPRGILNYPTAATDDKTRAWGTFEHIATGADGTLSTAKADPLIEMVGALKPQYRNGAVWLMNRSVAAKIRKLKEATSDRYLWSDSLSIGQPESLLGYPVLIDDQMPDAASGSLSVAFGNVQRAYTIIEKPGVRLLNDPYTAKPFVRLFAYRRVGAGVNNTEALKFLKFATS